MTVKVAKTTSPHTAALESLSVWQTRLGWLSLVFVLVGLGMAFFYAPTEATMGDVYRLFFFHMPAAIAGFAGFFVTFVASIAYLVERSAERDMWAVAGAETGIVFSLAGILGGMFWARPVWNVWWTWDARLTSVTIMMLTYIAYMMLRQAIDDPERRARFAAVMGIVGFVNIPLVWFSTRWIDRTIHPVLFGGESAETAQGDLALTQSMEITLMVCMVAVLLLFAYFLVRRARLEMARAELARLREEGGTP
ncbi:heme exporter protein C [Ardenticatena maritima]|uniref:Heme exporter protein C n=1 Tax=Ardenticatena maritima TaxID=872965 RepID=A0A0M8K4Q9_9CHLR|nr:cytochrome c biogenesis protein CcsA [Ardenticatena maritima]GAP61613.1 heme exporter protein C [Ardenticatena maritima]